MGKVITEEGNYYRIAGAIRSKLHSNATYLPSEMADAISSINFDISNGTKVSMKARSSTIPEKTFVEVYNSLSDGITVGEVTFSTIATADTAACKKGVVLEAGKAIFLYVDTSWALASVIVVDDGNGGVEYKTPVTITPSGAQISYSTNVCDISKISDSKVAICYTAKGIDSQSPTTYYTYCVLAEISGSTTTVGTPVKVSTVTNAKCSVSVTSSGRVVVAVEGTSSAEVIEYSVSNLTLSSVGSGSITIPSGLKCGYGIGILGMSSDRVFVLLGTTSSNMYCAMGTANSSGVTMGQPAAIGTGSSYGASVNDLALLSENRVIYLCSVNSSDPTRPKCGVVDVSGTTVSSYIDNTTIKSGLDTSTCAMAVLDSTHVVIVPLRTDNLCLITVGATTITSDTSYAASGPMLVGPGFIWVGADGNASVFATKASSPYSLGYVPLYGTAVAEEATTKIDGVAVEELTTSTAGDVWVLATA